MAVLHPGITVLVPVDGLRAAALGCMGNLDEAVTHAELTGATPPRWHPTPPPERAAT